jgi:hypothetical protein
MLLAAGPEQSCVEQVDVFGRQLVGRPLRQRSDHVQPDVSRLATRMLLRSHASWIGSHRSVRYSANGCVSPTTVPPWWLRLSTSASTFSASPRPVHVWTHLRRARRVRAVIRDGVPLLSPLPNCSVHQRPLRFVPFGDIEQRTKPVPRCPTGIRRCVLDGTRRIPEGRPHAPSAGPSQGRRPRNPKVERTAPTTRAPRIGPRWWAALPPRSVIPSHAARTPTGVARPAPNSRRNSRTLVANAWKRPFPMIRKGPLTRYLSWWRGQDLNLRPSGYETDSQPLLASRSVPSSTSEVGFRAFDVPVRTTADQPIPARGVEASVEALPARRSSHHATRTASFSLALPTEADGQGDEPGSVDRRRRKPVLRRVGARPGERVSCRVRRAGGGCRCA